MVKIISPTSPSFVLAANVLSPGQLDLAMDLNYLKIFECLKRERLDVLKSLQLSRKSHTLPSWTCKSAMRKHLPM